MVPRMMFPKGIFRLRARLGLFAPRLVIRPHVSWWLRGFVIVGFASLMLFLGFHLARYGGEHVSLCGQGTAEREELDVLRTEAGVGKNVVGIERAARRQLLSRVAELESENALLKEDVLVFERLFSVADEPGVMSVESFRIVPERPGRYRYRMLLIFHPTKQYPEFHGRLQLVLHYEHGGKREQVSLLQKPDEVELKVRNLVRRSGGFDVPPDAAQVVLEVHLFQGDTLKLKRNAQL